MARRKQARRVPLTCLLAWSGLTLSTNSFAAPPVEPVPDTRPVASAATGAGNGDTTEIVAELIRVQDEKIRAAELATAKALTSLDAAQSRKESDAKLTVARQTLEAARKEEARLRDVRVKLVRRLTQLVSPGAISPSPIVGLLQWQDGRVRAAAAELANARVALTEASSPRDGDDANPAATNIRVTAAKERLDRAKTAEEEARKDRELLARRLSGSGTEKPSPEETARMASIQRSLEQRIADAERAATDATAKLRAAVDSAKASPAGADEATIEVLEADVEQQNARVATLKRENQAFVDNTAPVPAPRSSPGNGVSTAAQSATLRSGKLEWGVVAALVQLSVARSPSESARERDYVPRLDFVPSAIGFRFTYQPSNEPWRLPRTDKGYLQLMGAGGFLLVQVDTSRAERGALSIGGTLTFFENLLGLGLGFDLYRGVPVRGSDGAAGSETAATGLVSWAFTRKGQVTPENVFVVLTLGLDPIVRALSGQVKE